MLKKLVKLFFLFCFLLIVSVVAGLYYILNQPTLEIKDQQARWLKQRFLPKGIELDWHQWQMKLHKQTFWQRKVELELTGLCFKVRQLRTEGCFESLSLNASINLKPNFLYDENTVPEGPRYAIERLHLLAGDIFSQGPDPKDAQVADQEAASEPTQTLPELMDQFLIQDLLVTFKQLQYEPSLEDHFIASGKIALSNEAQMKAELFLEGLNTKALATNKKNFILLNLNSEGETKWPVELKLKTFLQLQSDMELSLSYETKWQGLELAFDQGPLEFQLSNQDETSALEAIKLIGSLGFNQIQAELQLKQLNLEFADYKIALNQCPIHITLPPKLGIDMDCAVSASLPPDIANNKVLKDLKLKKIQGQLALNASDVSIDDSTSKKGKFEGSFKFKHQDLLNLNLSLSSQLNRPLDELAQIENINPALKLNVQVQNFQKVVKLLDAFELAPPAPFYALQGTLGLTIDQPNLRPPYAFPFHVVTELKSPNQRLNVESTGNFQFIDDEASPYMGELRAAISLNNVDLILPPIINRPPPTLFPDDRIQDSVSLAQMGLQKQPAAFNSRGGKPITGDTTVTEKQMKYNIVVKTPNDRPIQIKSNLAKTSIPVYLNMEVDHELGRWGDIRIDQFPIDFFRKNAVFESMQIKLNSEGKSNPLEGTIKVFYLDYTITFQLHGTMEDPQLAYYSNPPLSKEDIISVLLFGRQLSDVTSGQVDSVQGMQNFLSSASLSLFSLYFFASTPIESIGYNPETSEVTAKIGVGKGNTLLLGADAQKQYRYGLRRSLGNNFFLTTELQQRQEAESLVASFIEWVKRY